jgi:nitrate reductase gamma subunit
MSGLQLLMYAAIFVFLVGTLYKLFKIARMPLHIRWDLYPIPHERGKGEYGGSYFEEIDWWTKPSDTTLVGEMKEMGKEIFFIQSMFRNNRPLWAFSFPFHFGLYLMIGFVAFLLLGAILQLSGVAVAASGAGTIGVIVYYVTIILGVVGSILGTVGAVGLLISRLARPELRRSSVWPDYFNLLLLGAVFVTAFWTWAAVDSSFGTFRSFIEGAVTFSRASAPAGVAGVHIGLAAVFMLWLPFTHMTHFVGKYFTYHKVRWEDHPNIRGSKLEEGISEALGYKITWSASHIKGDTWAEAATATDTKEAKKDEN